MVTTYIEQLLFHGAVVMMAGIVTGFLYWIVIITGRSLKSAAAWRVAHAVIISSGLMMMIIALVIPYQDMDIIWLQTMVTALIASGYGFVFAFTIGAWKQIRGLTPAPWGFNTVLFTSHFIGSTGSFIGIAILIYGLS